jgi:alkanesulfonate monooxygenase SsuD/methylene tetrahydromethanopterin reductase-like flavin-dependent oxidoreductase (luciferase family)
MVDVMSGGRLEVAFPLGTGMEYWVNAVNPAKARSRFRESLEIILKAWTEDGPGRHVGRHFTYRYLNPWVRPVQKPHPKCYVVGTGSPETVDLAVELGFGYSVAFSTHQAHLDLIGSFRDKAKAQGKTVAPDQLPLGVMAYVADTDEQAVAEYLPHIRWYFERGARTTARYLTPPGYVSLEQYGRRAAMAGKSHGAFDWDELTTHNRVVAGSPETVAGRIAGWMADAGSSLVNCQLHLGDMPHWKTVKNLTLLAEEVMPHLKTGARERHRVAAE